MAPEPRDPGLAASAAGAFRRRWGSALLSGLLVAGVAFEVQARDRRDREDTAPRHERIRLLAASAIPLSVDEWLGRDVAPTAAAVSLLRPNVLVNRTYDNLRTRESASLCFVQCADARDLLGHFPPVCYRGNGMSLESAVHRTWRIGDVEITGMRYRFRGSGSQSDTQVAVDNFIALPVDGFTWDMDAVARASEDPVRRHLGAAQLQIATDGAMTDDRRDEVFLMLLSQAVPLLLLSSRAEVRHD